MTLPLEETIELSYDLIPRRGYVGNSRHEFSRPPTIKFKRCISPPNPVNTRSTPAQRHRPRTKSQATIFFPNLYHINTLNKNPSLVHSTSYSLDISYLKMRHLKKSKQLAANRDLDQIFRHSQSRQKAAKLTNKIFCYTKHASIKYLQQLDLWPQKIGPKKTNKEKTQELAVPFLY